MDELEERLRAAGATAADDAGVRAALADAVAARTRRRRLPIVAAGAAVVLAVGGDGAAAAAGAFQWSEVTDPDFSISRDWYDVAGNYLGSCEERFDVELLDEQVRPIVEAWFASHEIDEIQPSAELVAYELILRGEPERMPELLPGETVETYRSSFPDAAARPSHVAQAHTKYSDARILQAGLSRVVHREIVEEIFAAAPELASIGIRSLGESHCTTDWDQRR